MKRFVELALLKKQRIGDVIGPLAMHTAISVLPQWVLDRVNNKNYWRNFHQWLFFQTDSLIVPHLMIIEWKNGNIFIRRTSE